MTFQNAIGFLCGHLGYEEVPDLDAVEEALRRHGLTLVPIDGGYEVAEIEFVPFEENEHVDALPFDAHFDPLGIEDSWLCD